jgi:dienelactone hydrolase
MSGIHVIVDAAGIIRPLQYEGNDVADVLLFHHAQGLTQGITGFAGQLQAAGHTVHVPDLFDGQVFATLREGAEYAAKIGFGTVIERGQAAAAELPAELVYAGFSLGVLPAQMLAQTRAGATGALLFEACVPVSEFGGTWPAGVPVQVHGMEKDEFFAGEGDIDAARALVQAAPNAELFTYPGNRHLFADSSLPSYDEPAAGQLTQRVLAFLEGIK